MARRKARKAPRAARPARRRTKAAGKKLDGKSVREMPAEFNKLVPEAERRGVRAWWIKDHVSPFESRAAAVRMIDRL